MIVLLHNVDAMLSTLFYPKVKGKTENLDLVNYHTSPMNNHAGFDDQILQAKHFHTSNDIGQDTVLFGTFACFLVENELKKRNEQNYQWLDYKAFSTNNLKTPALSYEKHILTPSDDPEFIIQCVERWCLNAVNEFFQRNSSAIFRRSLIVGFKTKIDKYCQGLFVGHQITIAMEAGSENNMFRFFIFDHKLHEYVYNIHGRLFQFMANALRSSVHFDESAHLITNKVVCLKSRLHTDCDFMTCMSVSYRVSVMLSYVRDIELIREEKEEFGESTKFFKHHVFKMINALVSNEDIREKRSTALFSGEMMDDVFEISNRGMYVVLVPFEDPKRNNPNVRRLSYNVDTERFEQHLVVPFRLNSSSAVSMNVPTISKKTPSQGYLFNPPVVGRIENLDLVESHAIYHELFNEKLPCDRQLFRFTHLTQANQLGYDSNFFSRLGPMLVANEVAQRKNDWLDYKCSQVNFIQFNESEFLDPFFEYPEGGISNDTSEAEKCLESWCKLALEEFFSRNPSDTRLFRRSLANQLITEFIAADSPGEICGHVITTAIEIDPSTKATGLVYRLIIAEYRMHEYCFNVHGRLFHFMSSAVRSSPHFDEEAHFITNEVVCLKGRLHIGPEFMMCMSVAYRACVMLSFVKRAELLRETEEDSYASERFLRHHVFRMVNRLTHIPGVLEKKVVPLVSEKMGELFFEMEPNSMFIVMLDSNDAKKEVSRLKYDLEKQEFTKFIKS